MTPLHCNVFFSLNTSLLPLTGKKISGKAGPAIATQKAALKPESTGKQVKLVEPSKDDEDDDSSDEVFCRYIVEHLVSKSS